MIASSVRAERPKDTATLTYLPSPTTGGVCPAAEFLELEVEIRLGYELFRRSAPNHFTVEVERVDTQFRAVGEMRDDAGKIVFTEAYLEPECTAAVVDMAMMVALELTRPPSDPEARSPTVSAASCPPADAATRSPPPSHAPPPTPFDVQMGLAAVFAYGKAPVVLGGFGAFFGVRWQNVEVAVEVRALFAVAAEVESFRARTGYSYLYAAISGAGCYHKWWAFGCARVELGLLSITTAQIVIDPGEVALLGAGIRLGGEKRLLPSLTIRIYTDISAEMLRPVFFRTEGLLTAWYAPRISAAVGVGPVLSWGN